MGRIGQRIPVVVIGRAESGHGGDAVCRCVVRGLECRTPVLRDVSEGVVRIGLRPGCAAVRALQSSKVVVRERTRLRVRSIERIDNLQGMNRGIRIPGQRAGQGLAVDGELVLSHAVRVRFICERVSIRRTERHRSRQARIVEDGVGQRILAGRG